MRLAYYYLASVLLAIAVIGAVAAGVSMRSHRKPVAVRVKPAVEVYVDLDKLMIQHPDMGALQTLESAVSELDSSHGFDIEAKSDRCNWAIPESDLYARVAIPRWKLEDSAAQHADAALKQLQEDQLAALSARTEASLKTMRESAESDVQLKVREIQQEAAEKTARINQKYGDDFVRLRVASLGYLNLTDEPGLAHVSDSEIRLRSVGPVKPKIGVDSNLITQRLGLIVNKLDSLSERSFEELANVDADARNKIAQIRADSTSKLETVVRDFQNGQTRKIQTRIKDSQSEIMGDIQRFGESPVLGFSDRGTTEASLEKEATTVTPVFKSEPGMGPAHDVKIWRSEVVDLRYRIRKDLICQLRNIADKRGVKIVFVRNNKTPDQTELFRKLLMGNSWRYAIPVMRG